MVYNFSCNDWSEKKKPDLQQRGTNKVFLPLYLDIVNYCVNSQHRSRRQGSWVGDDIMKKAFTWRFDFDG